MTSLKKYAAPLRLDLRSSRVLLIALFGMHAGAMFWVLYIGLEWWLMMIITAMIFFSAVITFRRFALRTTPDALLRLTWDTESQWWLQFKGGREVTATLEKSTFVHPLLTILHFTTEENRRVAAILLPDNVDRETFRQLRVRLRVEHSSAE